MNTLMKTGVAAALLATAVFANAAEAQQKVGVINVQEVLQNLPQARELETQVQTEFKSRIDEVSKLENQMRELQEKAQRDASIMSNQERLNMQREMEMLETTYQLKVKAVREDMGRRQNELRDQLLMDIMRNTQDVATAQQFDLVLQRSALAYATEASDLTDAVIKKMTGGN
ncbi:MULTISPECIES: OmpH family outer membrane protein [Idiomarinaceae]|uniref:OmpH family outer membrane protein n=2 Tax=Pseudidiomarina TaxID=2800384 RepID=A0AB39X3E5_9GAMM|nr:MULTISPECIES: OmpH family outer membrane protein [Idiomarinaceae]MDX1525219.1 OmpH family outer membrane protein [Pseudidiomarina maritima]NCU56964.1 molecular chaperone [Idiomarina sp. FenA--70]NCU59673.1 molecular chaperone [Idiomarina sp. FenBw--71]MDT7524797.1 OmpH family outer membrane protein [Pseudidiomarina sp. GXY010]MRJ41489.1 molecular chaperone [Idiomarina sp. FeN1]